ncbi:MAG: thiamine phosphate synthase [Pseudomonadota bacterium]|jgi:thiamine-phosphate pyrophosphorylase
MVQSSDPPDCRLYLITPPRIELARFADDLTRALDGGDVACIQLRLKDVTDDVIKRAAEALIPIARRRNVAFIINDRPDLARITDADGAHIGQSDMTYAEARKILGTDRILGVTCHNSRHLAMEAAEAGADYVAFGAFFPTLTKDASTYAAPELLSWWQETFLTPCVAIGGITVGNCSVLIDAGADFIAVSGGVWNYPQGPEAAVTDFNRLLRKRV